jgi:hypothetical protein
MNLEQDRSGKQVTSCDASKNSRWRARAGSHKTRILELLRLRGSIGVRSDELYSRHDLYGVSPRNRVSELRRDGFSIQTVHVNSSVVRYILVADHGERPTTAPRAVVASESTTLPLFGAPR